MNEFVRGVLDVGLFVGLFTIVLGGITIGTMLMEDYVMPEENVLDEDGLPLVRIADVVEEVPLGREMIVGLYNHLPLGQIVLWLLAAYVSIFVVVAVIEGLKKIMWKVYSLWK